MMPASQRVGRAAVVDPLARLARLRVPLGFLFGVIVFWLARPSARTLAVGAVIAFAGEMLRLWAAGHLEKSREVTQSGPYRWMRHPLYVGSSVMGIGVAVAAASAVVVLLVAIYLVATLTAAIRTENAFLRARFGEQYEAWQAGQNGVPERRFSLARAWRNREYRALIGLAVAIGLLALRMALKV